MTIVMERDDIERCVEALSEISTQRLSSTVNGRLRRPLKIGIAKDIKADVAADPDSELKFCDIDQVLTCNHVGYQYACSVAGAWRVNLDGVKVGTVTELEARNAKARATEIFAQPEARKRPRFLGSIRTPTECRPHLRYRR